MKISLIVCTYMRPVSLKNLLVTVESQTVVPDEVLIVDGSTDNKTEMMIRTEKFDSRLPLKYFKVDKDNRGLTKQRNYGLSKVDDTIDVVAFLDDDIELTSTYFQEILHTYVQYKDAVAVGGVTCNDTQWVEEKKARRCSRKWFCFDGWCRKNDLRFRLRERLGLITAKQPATVVPFGHERSVGFLPPSGKIYKVDFIMGGIASYRKEIFDKEHFSPFFEGYGLYEDKDFSLRIRHYGSLYVTTRAQVEHHHDPLGRPDYIKYGKMVVWNGWRVWRVATPTPSVKDRLKWWAITLLLTYVRFGNALVGPKRKDAWYDFLGRHLGMFKLIMYKPELD